MFKEIFNICRDKCMKHTDTQCSSCRVKCRIFCFVALCLENDK